MPDKAVELALTIGATQERVLGGNPFRTYALLVNDGPVDLYLGMGVPAVVNRGIRLNNGGGNYEINLTNPWQGEIYAVTAATSTRLLIEEW